MTSTRPFTRGGDDLRDHAAHGSADDMRALDAERIEQADGVLRHVVQRIAGLHR
jgi:hypothetical protein